TQDLNLLMGGDEVRLRVNYRGRARIAELQDVLRGNRLRDPSGILTDGRHLERDLTVSILFASEDKPVSLAFFDLNGMKRINDTRGYSRANVAIRAYLDVVAAAIDGEAEAYRVHGGGDEVAIRMPGTTLAEATTRVRVILRRLNVEHVRIDDGDPVQLA